MAISLPATVRGNISVLSLFLKMFWALVVYSRANFVNMSHMASCSLLFHFPVSPGLLLTSNSGPYLTPAPDSSHAGLLSLPLPPDSQAFSLLLPSLPSFLTSSSPHELPVTLDYVTHLHKKWISSQVWRHMRQGREDLHEVKFSQNPGTPKVAE